MKQHFQRLVKYAFKINTSQFSEVTETEALKVYQCPAFEIHD